MRFATLIKEYQKPLEAKYGNQVLPGHKKAMAAIIRCRTPEAGTIQTRCSSCDQTEWQACSCGHRSCPQCQNHEATRWLERQREKLLPVQYFLITFTLPKQLRPLAWQHQRLVYTALFDASSKTLKKFGLNPKHLGAQTGMTAILHTHSRRLTYHPHIHVVIPGGGIDVQNKLWRRTRYKKFMFHHKALAKMFRGKLLHEITKSGLKVPSYIPQKLVVNCRKTGRGEPALKYLSRYLYRGVISESNIISNHNGIVRFRYKDGETGETRYEELPGEEFVWRVIQHVLPRGYQRVRSYGFLHHNARHVLHLLQLILNVVIKAIPKKERPLFCCEACGGKMVVVSITRWREEKQFKQQVINRQIAPRMEVSDL